jgi:large subunit ribosomal protein L10
VIRENNLYKGGAHMNQSVLEHKKQIVSEISEKIKNAKSVVLVEYKGLTVEKANELRNKCREAGVEYKVYKNTLMRFAFEELGYKDITAQLEGPNAIALSYDDEVSAARVTNDFAKATNEIIQIKAGISDGRVINADEVKALASVPSRDILLAQLAGVLQGNLRNLAYMLDQIAKKDEDAA